MWPQSLPQKCQVHKLRNVLAKLPRGVQAEIKKQIHAVFEAKDYETGLKKGRTLIEDYRDRYPRAMECLEKSLEAGRIRPADVPEAAGVASSAGADDQLLGTAH